MSMRAPVRGDSAGGNLGLNMMMSNNNSPNSHQSAEVLRRDVRLGSDAVAKYV